MTKHKTDPNAMPWRQEAEAKIAGKQLNLVQPHPEETLLHQLIYELRVQKIELEMQNEHMQQTQLELEKSRDRYVEYYDLAPVGYLTLNPEGIIDEVNLTGAALLGVTRRKLTHRRFTHFIAQADRVRWHFHFQSVLRNDLQQSCELLLQNEDKSHFHAKLDCVRRENNEQELVVRVVLTDVSECHNLRAAQQQSDTHTGKKHALIL